MKVEDPRQTTFIGGTRSQAEFGSDYIVEVIRALGIEYAAFNPGSSFRGIHDSLVNFGDASRPQIIECLHEEISVAIAHGYAKAAGKPMVAIAHNVVGLQHATMAIYNAWVDRVPMLVLGGTGPVNAMERRPGIDWIHTANVQGNLVRDYVKWDDQPASLEACAEGLLRAYRVATTEPTGPTYVCFSTELQEMHAPQGLIVPDVSRYQIGTRLAPDPHALEQLAEWLVASRRPVLIADQVGRSPEVIPSLLALAEALGAPVIDRGHRFNMPTTHPLDATGAAREALVEADLVLLLDVHDPFGALTTPEGPAPSEAFVQPVSARLCQISVDELLVRSWTSDYQRQLPLDLLITADTALALPMLVGLVRERLVHDSAARDHFSERGAEWADRNRARRRQWREEAAAMGDRSPLALGYVASVLWDLIRDENWALVNRALGAWPRRLWSFREPHQLLGGSGGEGLGYGMGAAIGAALAYRGTDRIAVNLQADGDLLFTPSALWTAAHYQLPTLTVVHNNRSLYNSEDHALRVGRYRERPVENAGVGTQIRDPNVDFANLARTFGLHGEGPISTAAELRPALERALRVVKEEGRTAVVDVVCEPR